LGCWDPAETFCYLPYAENNYYFEEGRKFASLKNPEVDWRKSLSTFTKAWRNSKWHGVLQIKRHKPVSSCAECKMLSKKIMSAKTLGQMNFWKNKRALHHLDVKAERKGYYDARENARKRPKLYMCLIIDGMDQKKTDVPGAGGRRDRADFAVMKTRIVGVKVHGRKQFFYVCPPNIPHNINGTWSMLMDVINQIRQGEPGQRLPPNLHIQMDNTTTDNKTKVHFLATRHLVQAGVFKSVMTGFLPVGHTHEDIDQSFSVIARHLYSHPCDTFEELVQACLDSFAIPTSARVLLPEELRDIKAWLGKPVLPTDMPGISDVHAVNFSHEHLNAAGLPVLRYKQWTRQEHWIRYELPMDFTPNTIFSRPFLTPWDMDHLKTVVKEYKDRMFHKDVQASGALELEGAEPETLLPFADMKTRQYKKATVTLQWYQSYLERCAEEHNLRCMECVQIHIQRKRYPNKGTKEKIQNNQAKVREIIKELQEHRDAKDCSESTRCRLNGCWVEERLVRWAKKVCHLSYSF
jgi:hypothetical protein